MVRTRVPIGLPRLVGGLVSASHKTALYSLMKLGGQKSSPSLLAAVIYFVEILISEGVSFTQAANVNAQQYHSADTGHDRWAPDILP